MLQTLEKIKLACAIVQQYKATNTVTIDYPFENEILNSGDNETLLNIYNEVNADDYEPSAAFVIDVPKAGGLIRHFSYLVLKDQLLFILLMIDCFPFIYNKISGAGIEESLNIFQKYPQDKSWTKHYLRGAKDLMEKRQPLFNKGYDCILSSDISAFAPNIDIKIICTELAEAGVAVPVVSKLNKCLRKWSPLGHKGIPQLFMATDLLSEFYLLPVDNFFRNFGGCVYLRESDNIEIWCRSEYTCKQMLVHLARRMYERGLYLNINKTRIVQEKSIDKYEHPLEHKRYGGFRYGFKNRFSGIMHFYYSLEEKILLNECSSRLTKNPEFTWGLLQHYLNEGININKSLVKFLTSNHSIYAYQNYVIIRWLQVNYKIKDDLLLQLIRQMAWNDTDPYYLQSAARHFIYKHGTDSDRKMIAKRLEDAGSELERIDLLYIIRPHNTKLQTT